jgi:hypothetical protein
MALKHSLALVNIPGKECYQFIGMGGEGGTKAFAKTVEASQLGSHGSMVQNTGESREHTETAKNGGGQGRG